MWWPDGSIIFALLTTTDGMPSFNELSIDPGSGSYEADPVGVNPRRITFSHSKYEDQIVEWTVR